MSFLNPFHGWNKVILVNIVESSLRETGYPCVLTHDQTLQDTTATKRIAADKTKFPLGIDPVKDCDSHVKASPQTQTLETTNIVPTTNFLNVTFSLTDGTTLEKLIQAFLENHDCCSDLVGPHDYRDCCFYQSQGGFHSEASEVLVANVSTLSSRSTRALRFDK